uniref:NADH:ubiquinone oxidoreductase subunit C2 n=1 Tax=Astyanax mexicanus TaxID=7994 RepID=A0A3B1J2P3_ASTMX
MLQRKQVQSIFGGITLFWNRSFHGSWHVLLHQSYTHCVHRQALFVTVGWVLGYYCTKFENYVYAKLDRDMNEYVQIHPELFPQKEKKTFAEIVEPFHPIR